MLAPTDVVTLPRARGPWSGWVLERLDGRVARRPRGADAAEAFGDDVQLALYLCYETHFSPLPGAAVDLEWDLDLLDGRRHLEVAFESALRDAVGPETTTGPLRRRIPAIIAADDGPSVSAHLELDGTLDEFREYVVHRSAYQLKEADAHTFGIARLDGRAKQLLAEIQAGEYGADAPDRTAHSALFAGTMRALGLDDRRHAYLDVLPASALAVSNLASMFGLQRRWRGALVGHLAVFEMTSVGAMRRYTAALARLGAPPEARRFFDVHVLADSEHEVLALDMVAALEELEPALADDVAFGARSVSVVEAAFAATLRSNWAGSPEGGRLGAVTAG